MRTGSHTVKNFEPFWVITEKHTSSYCVSQETR